MWKEFLLQYLMRYLTKIQVKSFISVVFAKFMYNFGCLSRLDYIRCCMMQKYFSIKIYRHSRLLSPSNSGGLHLIRRIFSKETKQWSNGSSNAYIISNRKPTAAKKCPTTEECSTNCSIERITRIQSCCSGMYGTKNNGATPLL